MKKTKKDRLEVRGWKVGTADEFLGLTPEECAFIQLKIALSRHLREHRVKRGWTQTYVAKRIGSSQSRVAKMEAGDPSVSMDLLVRSLLILGVPRNVVARVIAKAA